MKVVALVENQPHPGGDASGEHGLSLLIEADGRRVLFDAGASGLLSRNADALGLGEALARLDAVVLSHGHYDHTGGLAAVLRQARRRSGSFGRSTCPDGRGRRSGSFGGPAYPSGRGGTLPVFVRPGLFTRKVHRSGTKPRDIGVPVTRSEFEELNARFIEEQGPTEVLPDFFVTGEIARREEWEGMEQDLCIQDRDGGVVPDPFLDEQALAIRTDGGVVVFAGCAHRGLVNSIAAARDATGEDRVRAVFGGAHLRSASRERIERTVEAVARMEPELVVLGHCTGKGAEERFAQALGERFQPLRAGASWTLQ